MNKEFQDSRHSRHSRHSRYSRYSRLRKSFNPGAKFESDEDSTRLFLIPGPSIQCDQPWLPWTWNLTGCHMSCVMSVCTCHSKICTKHRLFHVFAGVYISKNIVIAMAPIGTEPCEQRPCCAEIWHLFKVAFQFFRTHTHCWHTRTFPLKNVASQKKQSWHKYSVPLRECQLWIVAGSILTCAIFLKMVQSRPRLLLDSWILIHAEPRFL